MLLYLNLLRDDMITDLLPWFSNVRSLSKHAFKSHNSNGEVIDNRVVILPAHYLRSHIARCSRSILSILRSPDPCNTKICDSDISLIIDHQVFWLDVPVDDLLLVAVFQAWHQTSHEETLRRALNKRMYLRVVSSSNLLYLQMWYLKSPPLSKSITKYKFSLSWKA